MSELMTVAAPLSSDLRDVDWQVVATLENLQVQERTTGRILDEISLAGATKVENETLVGLRACDLFRP